MEKVEKSIDTTINLDKMIDSLPDLSTEEKALARKGKLGLNIDMGEEKLITCKLHFPFSDAKEINKLNELSAKVMQQTMKNRWKVVQQVMLPPFQRMICQKDQWTITLQLPIQKVL